MMKYRIAMQAKYIGAMLFSMVVLGISTCISWNLIAYTINPVDPLLLNPFNAYAILILVGFLTTKPHDMMRMNGGYMSLKNLMMFSMQSGIYTVVFSIIAFAYWYATNPQ